MSRPLLVAQNNHVRRLTDPAALAAHALGVAVHDMSSDHGITMRPPVPDDGPWGPILVIGSVMFVDQWARQDPILSRWVFWNDARYDAEIWAETMGDLYLNHGGRATTTGEFMSSDGPAMHVRPRSGVKLIGDVIPDEDHAGRRGMQGAVTTPAALATRNVDPSLPIWISPPRAIAAEIRIWMIGGNPACWSTYRVDGRSEYRVDLDFCRQALLVAAMMHDMYAPDRHYVIDLALVEDGSWRLVEYNPIHSSGWYGADPQAMLAAFFEAERT